MSPRSCVVLGAARNGTSLVSGLISSAGRHRLGPQVWPANQWNATGYFESQVVNDLNDRLLTGLHCLTSWQPPDGARWLSALPETETRFDAVDPELATTMDELVRAPFCRKDPRFCHTLPAWGERLRDAVRVVVFREPEPAVRSMVRFAHAVTPLRPSLADAALVWQSSYRHVLRQAAHGDWIFLHLRQLGTPAGRQVLEDRLGVRIDPALIDTGKLIPPLHAPDEGLRGDLYATLCRLAGFPDLGG